MVAPKRVSFSGLVPRTLRRSSRVVGAASVMLRRTVSEKMKKVGRPACLASSRRQSLRWASSSSWAEVSSAAGGGGAGRLLGWTAEVVEVGVAGLSTALRFGRDDKEFCSGREDRDCGSGREDSGCGSAG